MLLDLNNRGCEVFMYLIEIETFKFRLSSFRLFSLLPVSAGVRKYFFLK